MKNLDVVYFLKRTPSEEIRYSLRTLKNLPHRNVWIYGYKPDWMTNVEHIATVQNGTKWQNTSSMMGLVVNNRKISDKFIVMNDDFFILNPIEKLPYYYSGSLEDRIKDTYVQRVVWEKPHLSRYGVLLTETDNWLKSHGYSTKNFELHLPMVIEKNKMKKCLEAFPHGGYAARRSLYGNMWEVDAIDREADCKVYNLTGFPNKNCGNFASTTDRTFLRGSVGSYIRTHFNEKSEYEQ